MNTHDAVQDSVMTRNARIAVDISLENLLTQPTASDADSKAKRLSILIE
jgi:hypothetical protein